MPLFLVLWIAVLQQAAAQIDPDADVIQRIRDEVESRSQIMQTIHVLTDRSSRSLAPTSTSIRARAAPGP